MNCGKEVYQTKGDASEKLAIMKKKWSGKGHAYFCGDCHGWHLASDTPKKRKRVYRESHELNTVARQIRKDKNMNASVIIRRYGSSL